MVMEEMNEKGDLEEELLDKMRVEEEGVKGK
jgi:hypothetical protein